MSMCSLARQDGSHASVVTLTYDNGVLTESMAKDASTKPRTRDYPPAVMGPRPSLYIGKMILDRLANGYSIQNEDPQIAIDRWTSVFNVALTPLLDAVLRMLLPAESLRRLRQENAKVFVQQQIFELQVVGDEAQLRVTYLGEDITPERATALALLGKIARQVETADYLGNFHDLAQRIKAKSNFELFEDAALDRLEKLGVRLRVVDYRHIQPTMNGFVGV